MREFFLGSIQGLKSKMPPKSRVFLRNLTQFLPSFAEAIKTVLISGGLLRLSLGFYRGSWGKYMLVRVSREVLIPVSELKVGNPNDEKEVLAYCRGTQAVSDFWRETEQRIGMEAAKARRLDREKRVQALMAADFGSFVLAVRRTGDHEWQLVDGDSRLTLLTFSGTQNVRAVVAVPVWWKTPRRCFGPSISA